MMLEHNFKPGFRIALHIKDLVNVMDTSHGVGAPLPLTAAALEMFTALKTDARVRITAVWSNTTKRSPRPRSKGPDHDRSAANSVVNSWLTSSSFTS